MNKEEALCNFWSSFGLPAFEENSVPTGEDAPKFPYITFETVTGAFDGEISCTASIWDRNAPQHSALITIADKGEEISRRIGLVGEVIPFDGGVMWLKRGMPFSQVMGEGSDNAVRRKYLNLTVEFISAN